LPFLRATAAFTLACGFHVPLPLVLRSWRRSPRPLYRLRVFLFVPRFLFWSPTFLSRCTSSIKVSDVSLVQLLPNFFSGYFPCQPPTLHVSSPGPASADSHRFPCCDVVTCSRYSPFPLPSTLFQEFCLFFSCRVFSLRRLNVNLVAFCVFFFF